VSFEVFLYFCQRDQADGITRAQIQQTLGDFCVPLETDYWHVEYELTDSCDILLSSLDSEPNIIRSAMVNRPAGDIRLWNSVFELMQLGNGVLYYAGCRAPLVANETTNSYLPAEMIDALGEPICVSSGEEIRARIQAD
jgi:hypothetical protein